MKRWSTQDRQTLTWLKLHLTATRLSAGLWISANICTNRKRKEKQNIKKQHTVTVKEIRLRPKTDPHDCETKLNHARKFFEKGHRVQFTVMFRGREMLHLEQGKEIMDRIIAKLEDVAKIDRPASVEGKRMTMFMVPK